MNDINFICIGAQKAGTGSLYHLLRSHKDVWLPPLKEQHFFNTLNFDERGERLKNIESKLIAQRTAGTKTDARDFEYIEIFKEIIGTENRSLRAYRNLFAPAGEMITGDITPAYSTLSPDTVLHLSQAFPSTEIIFIVREPLTRLWSQARMYEKRTNIPITTEITAFQSFCSTPSVVARSLQSHTISVWEYYFGKHFHVLNFNDLRDSPTNFYRQICTILGIDDDPDATSIPMGYNSKAQPSLKIPPKLKEIALEMLNGEQENYNELIKRTSID